MPKEKIILLILLISISTLISAQDFEGFETGDFSAYEWQLSGNVNWFVTNSSPYEGTYCAQGGDIDNSQTTALQVTRDITDNGTISFYWKVSSESNWDYLRFYLDGTQIQEISGTVGWTQVTTNVSTGLHTFKWEYYKDSSVSTGSDTGWIDNIIFPPTITYDNDLAGMTITGNTTVNSGNSEIYAISVKNVGYNTQTSYNVKLFKNNLEVASLDVNDPIAPDETVVHNLVWQIPANEPSGIKNLYGLITLEGDENTSNNDTNIIQVSVLPPGITQIQVGNGTILWNRTPVRFQYMNSLSEMLFFPDELNNTIGTIVDITFHSNFIHAWPNEEISIWMGETAQTNLTDGWIPSTQLTPVFNGNVSFPIGDSQINITLDTPFFYNGSNLVMMVHRPMGSSQTGDDNFYHTETATMIDRTRYQAENSPTVLDPANPPEISFGTEKFPNTTFSFFLGAMGDVEGYVYDDLGAILENAEIEIEELQMITYSNNLGFYHFGNVLTGTYNFTANKYGFSPQTIQGEVLEDQTTTIDFNLIPLGVVTVSGHVVGSDYPEIGLAGALVSVTGFENYSALTDGNGDFEITGVYTNITYDMSIAYEGYNTLYEDLVVAGVNLDLGTLILEEMSFPPGNVQAVQNAAQTEVDLTWNSPGQGGGEFRYDDGNVDFEIGFSSSPANGVFGAVHPNIAIIQEVQWFLTSTYGGHPNVKILILGLDEDNVPDVNQVYLISNLIGNVDDEWNSLILDDEINAPEGFFVGVITPGLYTSVGLDDGVGEPWIFQPDTQMSNENWLAGNNWSDIGDVGSIFQKNMMIRAYGINMGYTSPDDSALYLYQARSNENQTIAQTFPRFIGIIATTQTSAEIDTGNSREFESYNIYRFPFSFHNFPTNWDLIASAITDTFYTDTSWASLPLNTYQFALTSVHTNGVESVPSFSQALNKTLTPAESEILPSVTLLYNNIPNPFNPTTTINFSISENSVKTELAIYNVKGQKVKTLVNENLSLGFHSVVWNGKDDSGNEAASGLYFYKMKAGKYYSIKKMLLLK
ncbi:MAG: carboxypeptidase regulatory-like domain-containing protein [Candidatus Cloacimonadales bacterium]|nr:carboxypeptidase regulatory-like domain-containing protein [Candidatus Cloacimonadales bacterium]